MGKYFEIEGDATKPQLDSPNEIAVIPHCCNSIGVWGGGFTGALNRSFGFGPYTEYKKMEKESPYGLQNRLGEICHCKVNDNIYVVNMIAQKGIIGKSNPKPIKYWALLKAMQLTLEFIGGEISLQNRPYKIHTCRFGSELAGGNFEFIKELINEVWVDRGVSVIIYNFQK